MWVLSVQNSTRIFVDSINISSPKEKRHTKNEMETGTREAVKGERWQIMQTPCKQKARVFSSSSSPSHCTCLRERWGQQGIGDIEQTKGGGVVGHPRKDCIRKVVFKPLTGAFSPMNLCAQAHVKEEWKQQSLKPCPLHPARVTPLIWDPSAELWGSMKQIWKSPIEMILKTL